MEANQKGFKDKVTRMLVNRFLVGGCIASLLGLATANGGWESSANNGETYFQSAAEGVELASCTTTSGCEDVCDPSCDATGCDNAGCDGFGLCGNHCSGGLLGLGVLPNIIGSIKPSEHEFCDFVSPMTNPVYFEDPRQLTEARAIFIDHKIPALLGAPLGSIQVYALQARARLSKNWSLIATKDGFIDSQSSLLQDGWGDISAGLKYSLYRNAQTGRLLSAGARFEVPTGSRQALQARGDGVLDLFLTGGTRIGNGVHLLSATGFILPMDSQAENQLFYWSNHIDKRIGGSSFYAFSELNWYNYMKSGNNFPLPVEGGDLINLGSVGVAGNNIVTNAYGLKYKPTRNLEAGVAWEFPLTERRGILDNRLTADLILRY